MAEVLAVLAGYAFCTAAILHAGRALLLRLRLDETAEEQGPLCWMLGSAALSLAVFLLCAVGRIGRIELGVLLVLSIAAGWRGEWRRPRSGSPLAVWICALFLGVYCIAALAPLNDPDGYRYHLGFPQLYIARGAMTPVREDFYSAFPQAMEMQYLLALQFGGFSVARLMHWNALAALALAILATGFRLGTPRAGGAAAAVVIAASVVGTTAASANVDVALAAAIWIAFHCWLRWSQTGTRNWLIAASAASGLACAIKYTGVSALCIAAMFLLSRSGRLRNAATSAAVSAALLAPWLARNWLYFSNPVYPFLNSLFPNPYLLPSSEKAWVENVRHYNGAAFDLSYPWEAAIRGVMPMGFGGPFFLLAPLALLALRTREGRWLLAAGGAAALPWIFGNPVLRFGIPSLPFLAFAVCQAFTTGRLGSIALTGAVVIQAAMCFPPFIERWNKQWIFALKEIPWRAAFRLETPAEYWRRTIPSFPLLQYVEANTPPQSRILAFDGQEQFFTTRLLANPYASEESASAAALLDRAADASAWPSVRCVAELPDAPAPHLRIRQEQEDAAPWLLFEIEANGQPGAVTSSLNPWETALAFDRNAVTAWSSKQPKRAGMWIALSWSRTRSIRRISVVTSLAYGAMRVDRSRDGRHWEGGEPMQCAAIEAHGIPRRSVLEFKRRGWTHILAAREYAWLQQAAARPDEWGLRVVRQSGTMKLLRAD